MFYRLVGGGETHAEPHLKRTRLMHMFSNFVKHSKHLIKVCGNPSAHLYTQSYRSKSFILEQYGIMMHLPAIRGQLCISSEVAHNMHTMLITIRTVRQGPHKGLLKSSNAPLPRFEPWETITAKAPHPLPKIVETRRARQLDNITIRGESGNGRDLRPQQFLLSCPSCDTLKDCANNTLFKVAAVSLTCQSCKRNTTSTKWLCSHAIPWHTCEYHREPGMRCGLKRSKGIGNCMRDTFKAEQRLLNKHRRLGPLGSETGLCAMNFPSPNRIDGLGATLHLGRLSAHFNDASSSTAANSASSSNSLSMPNSTASHKVQHVLNKKKRRRLWGASPP